MSERQQRRAERVRQALVDWDLGLGEHRLPEDRVARMRADLLRADQSRADGRRAAEVLPRAPGDEGAWRVAPLGLGLGWRLGGARLAVAAAIAVILVALSIVTLGPWRSGSDEPPPAARVAGESREPVESMEPVEGMEPVESREPLESVERVATVEVPTALAESGPVPAPRDRPDRAGLPGRPDRPDRPDRLDRVVNAARAEAAGDRLVVVESGETQADGRRVRRLDFETASGRKIHWILDSDFRGVGGR